MASKDLGVAEVLPVDIIEISELVETDIDDLENEFAKFILETEYNTERISTNINMDELNELGDEIIKARNYIQSFAKGEKKTVREQAYNQLIQLPLIGNWAKERVEAYQVQRLKDSGVKDVLSDMFKNFDLKKKRLVELTKVAEDIRNQLLTQEVELQKYVNTLDNIISTSTVASTKMRALDMSIQAQTQDKVIKDQVYNKLTFIIELMEQLMLRMSKTIPTLKSQLMNETTIAGMIGSISDSVKMMGTLQELTNEIAKTSTENIQGLIIDVTKELSNGADIDFYRKSAETNARFQNTMRESRVKLIESTIKSYNDLKDIGVNTSNQLEQRIEAEKKALGLTLENMSKSSAA